MICCSAIAIALANLSGLASWRSRWFLPGIAALLGLDTLAVSGAMLLYSEAPAFIGHLCAFAAR